MSFYSPHTETREIYKEERLKLNKKVAQGLIKSEDSEDIFKSNVMKRLDSLHLSTPKSWKK